MYKLARGDNKQIKLAYMKDKYETPKMNNTRGDNEQIKFALIYLNKLNISLFQFFTKHG